MVIDASGNVGIGTTTPSAKLDVWGNLNVGTSSIPALFVNTANGRVGIGTASPTKTLQVIGSAFIGSAPAGGLPTSPLSIKAGIASGLAAPYDGLTIYNELNAKAMGVHLYWDNRDHTASDWDDNDPQTPCTDIGQWVAPVRTERSEAYYQSKFKNNQSYPGMVNDDQNFINSGRQPELGNGSSTDGDAWGTWGGFYDWDVNTIVDSTNSWECTIYLVGQSAVSIDNYSGDSSKCDVTIRKPQSFVPQPATLLNWELIDVSNSLILQSGVTVVDSLGVVRVNNLTFTKDPSRRRLKIINPNVVGINNPSHTNSNVIVYPNPAFDMVFVKGVEGEFNYQIYNYSGQVLLNGNTNKSIAVHILPSGFYTLIINDKKGDRYAKKLVINK
jgi:hypothetical protein